MEQKQKKEAIDSLKRTGIESYTFTCETGEECILRQPTAQESANVIPYIMKFGDDEKQDLIKAGKILLDACWIAGDEKIRKDESLTAEVAFAAIGIMNLKVADVKKN